MTTDHSPTGFNTGVVEGKRTSQPIYGVRYTTGPQGAPSLAHGETPFMPIDTPPRMSFRPPAVTRGLSAQVNLAGGSPVPRPFGQYQSETFPLALPSYAGPAAIGTRIGVQNNTYSPSSHWVARQRQEANTAKPVVANPFYGVPTSRLKRLRGRVVSFPFASPSWTTTTGRVVS